MAKTIKVIDLLNKIANGEEVPKKIRYDGFVWELGADINKGITYINNIEKDLFNEYLDMAIIESLNDTVEIIEEQQDIDIQEIEDIKDVFIENSSCGEDVKYLARKYNEILQAVKQLDKKI